MSGRLFRYCICALCLALLFIPPLFADPTLTVYNQRWQSGKNNYQELQDGSAVVIPEYDAARLLIKAYNPANPEDIYGEKVIYNCQILSGPGEGRAPLIWEWKEVASLGGKAKVLTFLPDLADADTSYTLRLNASDGTSVAHKDIIVNVTNDTTLNPGYFSPSYMGGSAYQSNTDASGDIQISVVINGVKDNNPDNLTEVGLYYRPIKSNAPLIQAPLVSKEYHPHGVKCTFDFPANSPSIIDGTTYDFELGAKDITGNAYWSGWGGGYNADGSGWVLYALTAVKDGPPYLGEVVGPEGGTVSCPTGKVKVVIPEGALSEPTRIFVLHKDREDFAAAAPSEKDLLSVVDCKPYGLVFNKPAQIIYTLDNAEIPGTEVELGLYNSLLEEIVSTGQTSVVPVDGYTLVFSISHFSTYAALKSLTPTGAPIGAGVKIPLPDMLTGAFSTSVPITVPPGRKGIQPALGLSYRSGNSNSWVGMGFGLNPGYIVRSTRLGPPKYIDNQDTFYFITDSGTTELVWLTDNLYQAKVESSFSKFFKENDDSWKVVGKDGGVLKFGTTADSKESSVAGTYIWYLTRAVDTNGNYIEFSYTKDQGKSYLSRIDYTGNEIGLSPTNSVEFFTEPRDDISSSYLSTARIVTAKRLKEIQVKVNYELVWRYVLEYAYSQDTNRSLLKSVTPYASDNKSLPVQQFSYQKAK